jgi:hypothetical protein
MSFKLPPRWVSSIHPFLRVEQQWHSSNVAVQGTEFKANTHHEQAPSTLMHRSFFTHFMFATMKFN